MVSCKLKILKHFRNWFADPLEDDIWIGHVGNYREKLPQTRGIFFKKRFL